MTVSFTAASRDGPLRVKVSDLDAWLSTYTWRVTASGHVYRNRSWRKPGGWLCRRVYLHREIMGLRFGDRLVVDHVNGDPCDNRRENLEIVTQEENLRRAHVKYREVVS